MARDVDLDPAVGQRGRGPLRASGAPGPRPQNGSTGRGRLTDGAAQSPGSHTAREAWRATTAGRRDIAACARDLAAEIRDRVAEEEEKGLLATEAERDSTIRALLVAARIRREHAAADRASAASDRHLAAEDRNSATADSGHARIELEQAHLDGLTGAQRRDRGRLNLQQQIEHSRRSGEPFALAFIDVNGLKELNDRDGHAAGDVLLQVVVAALKAGVRSYDPIVRLGGDEFLCGFTNTGLEASRQRVEQIRNALADGSTAASISVGMAILGERDTLDMLIARADADMYSRKVRGRIGG
jgi:diguanylate cyclase (GGDEF)-like protein